MQTLIHKIGSFARRQWWLLLLVALELVFLGVRFTADSHSGRELTLDSALLAPGCESAAVAQNGILFLGSAETAGASQTVCTTGKFDLPAGSYRVSVSYQNTGCTADYGFDSGLNELCITWDTVALAERADTAEGALWLTHDCTGDNALQMHFTALADSGDSLLIESVRFSPTSARASSRLWGALALFVFLDIVLLMVRGALPNPFADPKKARSALILAGIVLVGCLPLGLTYLTPGHDLTVHLSRIDLLAQALAQGQFPARLYPDAAFGKGYPFGIMYPDLLLYPFAGLRLMGFPLETVYKCYVLCITAATALITRCCLRRIFKSETIALTGTALYVLCYYRLTNLYVRAALGEYTAMAFLPLVVYGLWCIYTQPRDAKKAFSLCWLPLALGFTGLLQSHLLSALMAAFFTALVCLFLFRRTFTRPVLGAFCKAVGAAVLWNIWYLVPCLQYMREKVCYINTVKSPMWGFAQGAAFVAQLFSVTGSASGSNTLLPSGFSGDMPLTVGTVLGLAALLMLLVLVDPAARKNDPQLAALGGICLGLGGVALLLSTTLVPWMALYDVLPEVARAFQTVQFPWRFLSPGSILLVVAGCCALYLLPQSLPLPAAAKDFAPIVTRLARFGLAAVLLVMTVLPGTQLLYSVCSKTTVRHYLSAAALQERGYQASGAEYLPTAFTQEYRDEDGNVLDFITVIDNAWVATEPLAQDGVEISAFSRGTLACTFTAQNTGDDDRTVRLPLLGYPDYRITAGDTSVTLTRESGFVTAVLPAGWSGTVTVGWVPRLYWRLFDLISLAGIVATVFLCRLNPRKRQEPAN